jgi:hypothetical protein
MRKSSITVPRRKLCAGLWLCLICALAAPAWPQVQDELTEKINRRNDAYSDELERYFRDFLVEQYPERAANAWHRSYASTEAFLKSVEPNRHRYRKIFSPPDLKPTGPLERRPYSMGPGVRAEWLVLPLGGIKAEALFVVPERVSSPVPLIIAQH